MVWPVNRVPLALPASQESPVPRGSSARKDQEVQKAPPVPRDQQVLTGLKARLAVRDPPEQTALKVRKAHRVSRVSKVSKANRAWRASRALLDLRDRKARLGLPVHKAPKGLQATKGPKGHKAQPVHPKSL